MGQKELNTVSKMLGVKSIDIQNMESRLTAGDVFLNQSIGDEEGNDFLSTLSDDGYNPQDLTEKTYDSKTKSTWITQAIGMLNEREQIIIKSRKLTENSSTLDELGKKLKISKERVRQIETKALSKMQKILLHISQQNKEFFI